MQQHDARILRGAAIATTLCGIVSIVVAALMVGTPGAWGAALGYGIVLGCFGVGQLLVILATRYNRDLMLPASMFGFILKIAVLGILLVTLGRSEFMEGLHSTAFAVTALLCVLTWLTLQMRGMASAKIPHVEPEPSESGSDAERTQ
ncbi:hypothetical protein J4H86_11430 [Spiractinospora alimapuensis]|uniref:hypothetical protein n=1 Tax=Spiractinospora alimapuensis TaxID=2820884 RepID=UPI001F3FFF6C|nr:hypothetical protein [Spiractinospora alimapuensis]QVQ54237.1 hypothetical protein J4H86_11430 [Spiractinospora alimapuensis]